MARVICPTCNTEFDIVGKNESWNGFHECECNTDRVVGSLIPATNTNGENVMGTTVINSNVENSIVGNGNTMTNNGVNGMNNGMDMETLVSMVMNRIVERAVTGNATQTTQTTQNSVNGGKFGKHSKYYGKEICGFMWNPYLVPRFLPKQFKKLMKDNELNVDKGIKETVSLMDSIYFLIEECERLSIMGKIALQERKEFWSVNDMKYIFVDYYKKVQKYIDSEKQKLVKKYNKNHKKITYFKFKGHSYEANIETVAINDNTLNVHTSQTVLNVKWNLEDDIAASIREIESCRSYKDLFNLMNGKKHSMIKLEHDYTKKYIGDGKFKYTYNRNGYGISKVFLDGYKKKGAYYTLKDLIMFSNVEFEGVEGREAVQKLQGYLFDGTEGYVIYAKLKKVIGF